MSTPTRPPAADPLKHCASCGKHRGNKRKGWHPITRGDGSTSGWTCGACPRADEPIRRTVTKTGIARFKSVVDATPSGARDRRQAQKTFSDLEQARQWVAQVRAEVAAAGAYAAPQATTVAQLGERWLAGRNHVRAVTAEGNRSALTVLCRLIGDRDVRALKVSDVRQLVADLSDHGGRPYADGRPRPLSPRTVQVSLTALKCVLDLAVEDGLVDRNVARSVKPPRQVTRSGRDLEHWNPEQLLGFRDHADVDGWAGAWRLSLTGLRRSEVLGLRWSDVDFMAGTVAINQGRVALGLTGTSTVDAPKSAASCRVVPVEVVHAGTVELLRALKVRQAEDRLKAGGAWQVSGLVLVDALGRGIRPELYSDRFRRLCEEAGLPPIKLHSLRHSLAFWCHSQGVTPADAAALLGHEVQVHLATYLPGSGTSGIAAAAAALGQHPAHRRTGDAARS